MTLTNGMSGAGGLRSWPGIAPPPPPPPPPLPAFTALPAPADAGVSAEQLEDLVTLQRLERELEDARCEADAMHEMLEDLPRIFERKFQQRLQNVLDHQRYLQAENLQLREHLLQLNPAAAPGVAARQPLLLPSAEVGTGLAARLRQAVRLDRARQQAEQGSAGAAAAPIFNPADGGRPRAA